MKKDENKKIKMKIKLDNDKEKVNNGYDKERKNNDIIDIITNNKEKTDINEYNNEQMAKEEDLTRNYDENEDYVLFCSNNFNKYKPIKNSRVRLKKFIKIIILKNKE